MSMLSDALARLRQYNLNPFNIASNPFGLTGTGGTDTNLEPLLSDIEVVGAASADAAESAKADAEAAHSDRIAADAAVLAAMDHRQAAAQSALTAANIVQHVDVTERAGIPPALDWLFTSAAAVPSGVITSTSGKWVRGQNGLWTYVPAGTAPIEYGLSGDARGLRAEGAVTNPILYPSDFSNAAWTKSGSGAVTPDAKVAPDGTATADLLSDTDSGSDAAYWQQTFTVPNDTNTRCFSVFLAQGTAAASEIRAFLIGGSTPLSAGVVAKITWAGRVVTGSTGAAWEEDANGFGRLSVPITNNGTGNTTLIVRVYPATNATSVTGTAYAWQAQIDPGAYPSSIIPGTSSAVTRAADVNTLALSRVPGWNPNEGTIYIEYMQPASLSGNKAIFSIDSGSTANNMTLLTSAAPDRALWYIDAGAANQASISAGNMTLGATMRQAMAFAANDFAMSVNGAAAVTDTSGAVPSGLTTLRLGTNAGGLAWTGYIRRLTIFPRRISNAILPILTA